MTARSTRGLTREDLRDAIQAVGDRVDDRMKDFSRRLDELHGVIRDDRETLKETHRGFRVDIEALKKYKYTTAGGLGILALLLKLLIK